MQLLEKVKAENAKSQAEMKSIQARAELRAENAEERSIKAEGRQQRTFYISLAALAVAVLGNAIFVEAVKRQLGRSTPPQPSIIQPTTQPTPPLPAPSKAPIKP